jgi:hypothetical protein
MITPYDFGNPVDHARRGHLGLLGVRTDDRAHIRSCWARAREWPSFKRRLYDLMTPAEFKEMQAHGPKIREDVAALLAGLRRDVPPSAQ